MAKRLLLGMHDMDMMARYSRMAERRGYEVKPTNDPEEAVYWAETEDFDGYLVDANLGKPAVPDVAPSERIWNAVKDRVEAGEAKFLATSADDSTVQLAREKGMPCEDKMTLGRVISEFW